MRVVVGSVQHVGLAVCPTCWGWPVRCRAPSSQQHVKDCSLRHLLKDSLQVVHVSEAAPVPFPVRKGEHLAATHTQSTQHMQGQGHIYSTCAAAGSCCHTELLCGMYPCRLQSLLSSSDRQML